MNQKISRKSFLKQMAVAGSATVAVASVLDNNLFAFTEPQKVGNPLASYPKRDWEKHYRNLYNYDSTFHFLCAPNDTHNCLLKAYVKNGVVVRIGPSFGFGKATDIYGNKPSHRWDPRCCQKGISLARRFYGDRRVKDPMIRKGFMEWYKSGFERDPVTGKAPEKYMKRAEEGWIKVSWEEAYKIYAEAMINISQTYNGEEGKKKLQAQGLDQEMIDTMGGSGVTTLKFRGGMPALGATRVFAQYRLANMMALLDSKLRNVGPDKAVGARGWDNYSWHTDLPPGHPMVTGQQTNDFDLCDTEYSGLVLVWGMNWLTTKMPDCHWLSEARMKGAKIAVITVEYSATANKGDYVLVCRPGTAPALALGFCYKLFKEKTYSEEYVRNRTDLIHLVRMDNLELLKAGDVWADYKNVELSNYMTITKDGALPTKPTMQKGPMMNEKLRNEIGDFVTWDSKENKPVAISRDDYGKKFADKGIVSSLEGTFEVTLKDGKKVQVKPVFDLIKKYVMDNYDTESVSQITWAPVEGINKLYEELLKNKGKTLFANGMGPNQFFNNDLKDRTIFLMAALTENLGQKGGNVGSFAGNYRANFFPGLGQWINEDPFNITLEEGKPAKLKPYWKPESAHYFNHGEQILRMGKERITGKGHIPTPTKFIHVTNSNSLIGNIKGHFDFVFNTLPRVELLAVNEWWWTPSCEYADIVFAVDSWAEFKQPDFTMSVTNPFLYFYPRTPFNRIYNTQSDTEVAAGIAKAMAKATGDKRYEDYFKFVYENKTQNYIQRLFDFCNTTKGFDANDIEKKAQDGIPALLMTRTTPKVGGWEQGNEEKPYYTKTGRLEFYRQEKEFIDAGENMPVYREPIDSTFYEPNVILGKAHPAIKPRGPESYGVTSEDTLKDADARQGRNVVKDWNTLKATKHPLNDQGYKFIFHTPKYRHGAHTTGHDTDVVSIWFGPFGDMYRRDKRNPFVAEAYMDINPKDAKELGIDDGDYVYVDADPHDRPFRGWQKRKKEYEVGRLLCRARYYPGTPRGITRMWHNMSPATYLTVKAHKSNKNGLARSPQSGYISLFRSGSHQSCTRGWIKPTLMTDSLVRKDLLGQTIGKGFAPDVHCPTGAPREAMVKITKAESGGIGGKTAWAPVGRGLTPSNENAALKAFIAGNYIK